MNPKLIFLLMVLIIVGLLVLQKVTSEKSKEFANLERDYFEALQKFSKKEIDETELNEIATRFFIATGVSQDQISEKLKNDLSHHTT